MDSESVTAAGLGLEAFLPQAEADCKLETILSFQIIVVYIR